jgi:hypothetical protein
MSERVSVECFTIIKNSMRQLLKLGLEAIVFLEEGKTPDGEIGPALTRVEQILKGFMRQFDTIQKEMEKIEETRMLTTKEEEKYIDQIKEMVERTKPEIKELEEKLKKFCQ